MYICVKMRIEMCENENRDVVTRVIIRDNVSISENPMHFETSLGTKSCPIFMNHIEFDNLLSWLQPFNLPIDGTSPAIEYTVTSYL